MSDEPEKNDTSPFSVRVVAAMLAAAGLLLVLAIVW